MEAQIQYDLPTHLQPSPPHHPLPSDNYIHLYNYITIVIFHNAKLQWNKYKYQMEVFTM